MTTLCRNKTASMLYAVCIFSCEGIETEFDCGIVLQFTGSGFSRILQSSNTWEKTKSTELGCMELSSATSTGRESKLSGYRFSVFLSLGSVSERNGNG